MAQMDPRRVGGQADPEHGERRHDHGRASQLGGGDRAGDADRAHASGASSFESSWCILDHDAISRRNAQSRRRGEIALGVRLAARDVVARDEYLWKWQANMSEPQSRDWSCAGCHHGPRVRRERGHQGVRAGHGAQPSRCRGLHRDERRHFHVDVEMGRNRAYGVLNPTALRPSQDMAGVEAASDRPVGADPTNAFSRIDEHTIEVEEERIAMHHE